MLRFFLPTVACVAGLFTTTTARAADLSFCWVGANGYTMTGRMRVPDRLMSNAVLTENDVTAFKIAGYHEGTLLGTWDMASRAPNTTWHLRFDPVSQNFLTGDSFATTRSQGWNANGDVTDCGPTGFGFNSGNFAQDLCVNGQYIAESSVDPETKLVVSTQAFSPSCDSLAMTGKSPRANHSD